MQQQPMELEDRNRAGSAHQARALEDPAIVLARDRFTDHAVIHRLVQAGQDREWRCKVVPGGEVPEDHGF